MKKILIAAIIALTMCSCSFLESAISSYTDDILKAQEVTINSAVSGVSEKLTDAQQIGDFINSLEMDTWKAATLPENAERSGEFSFAQDETIKLGQDESDVQLADICKIYTYKDIPYITFEIAGISMDFEISQSAADFLNQYIQ